MTKKRVNPQFGGERVVLPQHGFFRGIMYRCSHAGSQPCCHCRNKMCFVLPFDRADTDIKEQIDFLQLSELAQVRVIPN